MIGKQLLVSNKTQQPIEPIGVPTSVSYVGKSLSPYEPSAGSHYTYDACFGYDGQSIYYKSLVSGDSTRVKQFKMATPYDITTLSLSSAAVSGYWGTGSGNIADYFINFAATNAIIRDNTFLRRGATGTPYAPISGGTYIGGAPFGSNYHNINTVNAGEYIIMFGNSSSINYLYKIELSTQDDFSTWGASAKTSYDLSAYEPSGASSSIKFSGAVINQGLNLLQWDSLNSQIKIWQNNAAFDFTSPTLVSTFSIPTSDSLIVGTEAEIQISYQGGYLFAQRQGSYNIFQFQFGF